MKKRIAILILPIIFTAQACDILLGNETTTGSRGVFFSVDSGDTWEASRGLANLALAGAPVSRIFVEGDKPQNMLAAALTSGMIASQDYGRGWFALLPDFIANDVFINPYNDQEIFVAGTRNRLAAILKSSDRGGAWVEVWGEPSGQVVATTLAFDRANPRTMYAGLSSGTILLSRDSGDTWTALHDFAYRVMDIAVGRSNIYVLTVNGFARSADLGRTWEDLPISLNAASLNALHLDSADDTQLLLGAANGLYRSADRGDTWTKLNLPATPEISNVTAVTANPGKRAQIFAGIRATIYRSDDNGATWKTTKLSSGRTISDIKLDPIEPNRVYAGLK